MVIVSVQDRIQIILVYGESGRNVDAARRLYADRFPENVPSRSSFHNIIKIFLETGSVEVKKKKRRKTVTREDNEINILAAVAHNPQISSRTLASDSGISKGSILTILKRHKFHPYHISLHQELHGQDFHNRTTFCEWARRQLRRNVNFFRSVLFSDESSFANNGIINRHNMHFWSADNPHWLRQVDHQRPWSVNVWCGIIGPRLIGPYFIDGTLNGDKYRDFLENHLLELLEDLTLDELGNLWFQHDGCPAHFSIQARTVLDQMFNGRWIGRGGPVHWPARSPDLTSPDFFLWGYLKGKVYETIPTTPENMRDRIIRACAEIPAEMLGECVSSFTKRVNKCIESQGHHFEHLL